MELMNASGAVGRATKDENLDLANALMVETKALARLYKLVCLDAR